MPVRTDPRAGRARSLAPVVVAVSLLAACSAQPSRVAMQEETLITSGFRIRSAHDPKGQSALRALPPNRVVPVKSGGQTIYVYADPEGCKCLYRGSAEAYRRYRILASERGLASDQALSSAPNVEIAMPDDWGLVEPEGAW
jgi:hypothetical protein